MCGFAAPPGAPSRGRPRAAVIVGEQLYRTHGLHRGQVIDIATAIPTRSGEWIMPASIS